ncbi:helix-turn-helix domain-containing protein [Emticicia sp. CRIBPO]|uniref:helix-turn-helix transcriptional regulator n=1 Tax=Emticicia sp. CRIBPO TaxID=2683258 RepID=UPI001413294D|nr:helix-turn-helix transcriptional regulator [Emticicia sp. CRIBPO]NBA87657.1 helix-turn-helix domain-containing protein [Emticicia sp. CRIBPO]
MELKDKIEKLIIGLGLTSTRFADFIEVSRPIISHILSGRNKPSLEIVQKIMGKFPELGYKWFLDDEEIDMEIVGQIAKNQDFSDLFTQFSGSRESNIFNQAGAMHSIFNSQTESGQTKNGKDLRKIEKIVVFYNDKTFTEFNAAG